MFSKTQLIRKYLHYWLTAANGRGHGIHSPFVYDFVRKVLMDKNAYPDFPPIETLRSQLKQDHTMLRIRDFGAGSRVDDHKERSISNIAKAALKPAKYSQLFYKIIRHYNYRNCLELGTSLGITSAYLAKGANDGRLYTFEGAPSVAQEARKNFGKLNIPNVTLTEGNFDETLPLFLDNYATGRGKLDFCFVDGNHREQPTIDYFERLLPFTQDHSVIILDDIHWSQGMENAWHHIIGKQEVRLTIDLFFVGLVFFRHETREKEHFVIRY